MSSASDVSSSLIVCF